MDSDGRGPKTQPQQKKHATGIPRLAPGTFVLITIGHAPRTFAWSSGQPVEFTSWQQGQPRDADDRAYVFMYAVARRGWVLQHDLANGLRGYPIYAVVEIKTPPGRQWGH